ncbi:MAG TPA: prepilin-type N-terminal cleavage/methylation domain-containing protein [Oligoflexia bacterium]|nr:prepilin-type N-terminal cleavage/methylation domain-containing protein [Oligoflexia bacterium]HMP27945.1 prepilin-type N-terminal cleavage/methylation domain-containing protein [Oligoflexia bacterium]
MMLPPSMKLPYSSGFTLVELLMVVVTIGILTAIAISSFENFRIKAYNAAAQNDLNNALSAQQAYYVDNQTFANCGPAVSGAPLCTAVLPGFHQTEGVDVSMSFLGDLTGNYNALFGQAKHSKSPNTFCYNGASAIGSGIFKLPSPSSGGSGGGIAEPVTTCLIVDGGEVEGLPDPIEGDGGVGEIGGGEMEMG